MKCWNSRNILIVRNRIKILQKHIIVTKEWILNPIYKEILKGVRSKVFKNNLKLVKKPFNILNKYNHLKIIQEFIKTLIFLNQFKCKTLNFRNKNLWLKIKERSKTFKIHLVFIPKISITKTLIKIISTTKNSFYLIYTMEQQRKNCNSFYKTKVWFLNI